MGGSPHLNMLCVLLAESGTANVPTGQHHCCRAGQVITAAHHNQRVDSSRLGTLSPERIM
jgi:hypothetical protein